MKFKWGKIRWEKFRVQQNYMNKKRREIFIEREMQVAILYEEETTRGERKCIDSNIIIMGARIILLGNAYLLRVLGVLRTARYLLLANAAPYVLYFLSLWFDSSSRLFTTIFTFIPLVQNFIIIIFKCYSLQETVQYQTSYRVTFKPCTRPCLIIWLEQYGEAHFLL